MKPPSQMILDLQGKLRNTRLPKDKALHPVFEAISNALQAIEAAGLSERGTVEVTLHRDSVLPGIDPGTAPVTAVTVRDDGVGFTPQNYRSFLTSDSRHKESIGGKGVGRFLWLVAFRHVDVESHFRNSSGQMVKRAFRFSGDTSLPGEDELESPDKDCCGTVVRLEGLKERYSPSFPRDSEKVAQRIVEHFMTSFLAPDVPRILLRDPEAWKNQTEDLNAYFNSNFVAGSSIREFSVQGHSFRLRSLRLFCPSRDLASHEYILAAHGRVVFSEKLGSYIPNLRWKLEDDGRNFVYIAFVEGKLLDDSVDSDRIRFSLPDDPDMLGEPSIAEIREQIVAAVKDELGDKLCVLNQEKRSRLDRHIESNNPHYLVLADQLDSVAEKLPPNATTKQVDEALHSEYFSVQVALHKEGAAILQILDEEITPEFTERLHEFVARQSRFNDLALAKYVAHRRVILDILEKSLRINPATGRHYLEERIHNIIFPMKRTSSDLEHFEEQNLWILDERLTHHHYLASDLPLKQMAALDNESRVRPDILILERPMLFAPELPEQPITGIVVIEFKKPGRGHFGSEDPIDQVLRIIQSVRQGQIKVSGRTVRTAGELPAYAYIVCEVTDEIRALAERKDLKRTSDSLGYFRYFEKLTTHVEVISFEKLVMDVRKRNRALFEKVGLPVSGSIVERMHPTTVPSCHATGVCKVGFPEAGQTAG